MTNQLTTIDQRDNSLPAVGGVYGSIQSFEDAQRMAKALAASSLVPDTYQGNTANTLIALEVSQRVGASPMAVMQNLHIIHGRPSWSSQFVIAALNSCGRFSPLRFKVEDLGETDAKIEEWSGPKGQRTKSSRVIKVHNKQCVAWAYDKATGDVLEGPPVTIAMAVSEGWYTKDGSKWVTMPDLMLRYRSAKFFGNLYAPDVLMGMHSADEVEDFGEAIVQANPDRFATRHANDNTPKGSPLDDLNSFGGGTHSHQSASATQVLDGEVLPPEGKKDEPAPTQQRRQRRSAAKTTPDPEQQQEQQQQASDPEPEQHVEDAQFEEVEQQADPEPQHQTQANAGGNPDLF